MVECGILIFFLIDLNFLTKRITVREITRDDVAKIMFCIKSWLETASILSAITLSCWVYSVDGWCKEKRGEFGGEIATAANFIFRLEYCGMNINAALTRGRKDSHKKGSKKNK